MLVTLCLSYLAIGSTLWALVFFSRDDLHDLALGATAIVVVLAHVAAIIGWPVVLWAMLSGGARVARARRRPF